MKKRLLLLAAIGGLLTSVACTQDPAEVEYRGDEFYGRSHEGALDSPNHETFSESSPRIKPSYARPVQSAHVDSVGISDLPPPSAQPAQAEGLQSPSGAPATASKPLAKGTPHSDISTEAPSKFIWPVSDGKIVLRFGPSKTGRASDGINIALAEGEPIWATAAGTVVYAGSDLKGYGNMVIIRHTGGWMSAYAHARSIAVKKDQTVKQGDIIGYVGMTGGVKTPQLHFAIRDGRTPVDPELYLPKK